MGASLSTEFSDASLQCGSLVATIDEWRVDAALEGYVRSSMVAVPAVARGGRTLGLGGASSSSGAATSVSSFLPRWCLAAQEAAAKLKLLVRPQPNSRMSPADKILRQLPSHVKIFNKQVQSVSKKRKNHAVFWKQLHNMQAQFEQFTHRVTEDMLQFHTEASSSTSAAAAGSTRMCQPYICMLRLTMASRSYPGARQRNRI